MGIPKFFRYISERYPLTSQLIQENKIPEFGAYFGPELSFYPSDPFGRQSIPRFQRYYTQFDILGSHPNDEDAHFRLSEEQIFTSIFTYVDHLFGKIKPKKLLFMAVDGVAPRAKMNQQRSRRFRTAKEAREVREKALRAGEKLPEEKAFDSNCITPGTPFMTRLSNQLRYFINKKITEDAAWREVEVILSGHEVPGEGEHKIMEYIRHSKAQPDYNPNVRHCLYGLDADLMMLGLLSHDPHFCLLREEVKFGPAARKKASTTLEQQKFFLLHLSLLREYLDLEFRDVAPLLAFPYNLERIIDDFVLFAVFVGNDFLPNLPDLHIHENGLEKLFDIYKRVLPGMDGYLNESGIINNKRLQIVLNELALTEKESFEKEHMDMNWMKGKQSKHVEQAEESINQGSGTMTKSQQNIFQRVEEFVKANRDVIKTERLSMLNIFSARDRAFISRLTKELNLVLRWDEYDEEDQNIVTFAFPPSAFQSEEDDGSADDDDEEEDWEDDNEGNIAVDRVLDKYARLRITDMDGMDSDERYEQKLLEKMDAWKGDYYREKLEIDYKCPEQMHKFIRRYAEGLQWVMLYYYSGVASWGWFYDYHYAPRISDLKGIEGMSFEFTLGTPFKPFEQLMGVLPEASKELIPAAFRDLMSDPTSSILDFYPADFQQDLNGKKQDWEAIVKIPFIDEERLLKAMATKEHLLTAEEKQRNTFGTSTKFKYDPSHITTYPSSLPGFFPDIHRCQCAMEAFDLPTLDGLHLVEGLCDGVFLGASALAGFPSLKTIPHSGQLGFHNVNVFQADSKNKSMVIHIHNHSENKKTEEIAREMVGKRVFIGWPFLQEGITVAVSDSMFRHEKEKDSERIFAQPHNQDWTWQRKVEKIEYTYSKRFGVVIGPTDYLVHVRPLKGLQRLDSGALIKEYEDEDKETEQVAQLAITHVESEDPRFLEKDAPSLREEFPQGSKIFFLGEHAYGVAAQVSETTETTLTVVLAFFPSEQTEAERFTTIVTERNLMPYTPSYRIVDMLGISPLALSRITSTFMVIGPDGQKINLGLNLKYEAKSLKVLGYTRKSANGRSWEFSDKAVELIGNYKGAFPSIFTRLDSQGHDMVRASDIFPKQTDNRMKEVRAWLNGNGVRDLEAVSLFCDTLEKDTIMQIEQLADGFNANKSPASIKKAIVKGIPRQAVLKPEHAVYRLQNQRFGLGDRVTMVQDSGGVPLCAKGTVVSLSDNSMDVVWDNPFLSGTDLSGRCSQYRGSTCMFNACLNLTHPQYIVSTRADGRSTFPPKPALAPYTVIKRQEGTVPASGFRPASNSTVRIMTNPHRGRGAPPYAHEAYSPTSNGAGRGRGSRTTGADGPTQTSRNAVLNDGSPSLRGHAARPHLRSENHTSSAPTNHSPGHARGGFRNGGVRDESNSTVSGGRGFSSGPAGRGSFHPSGRGSQYSPGRGGRGSPFRGGRGGLGYAADRASPAGGNGGPVEKSSPTQVS